MPPAWGYDPAFSLDVQTALQDQGYYTGEVDGLVGPKTREALAAYQTDHELEVTSAVDEPTVEALGLIQNAWSCAPVVGDWRNL